MYWSMYIDLSIFLLTAESQECIYLYYLITLSYFFVYSFQFQTEGAEAWQIYNITVRIRIRIIQTNFHINVIFEWMNDYINDWMHSVFDHDSLL